MATRYALAMTLPAWSFAGQNRTWCPHGPGQPFCMSLVTLFLVLSLHSPETLRPKTPPGVKVPVAATVVEPFLRGNTVWALLPPEVTIVWRVVDPLACQAMGPVPPRV